MSTAARNYQRPRYNDTVSQSLLLEGVKHEAQSMTLSQQLMLNAFPFARMRCDVVAAALLDAGFKDIEAREPLFALLQLHPCALQDLCGKAHKLPFACGTKIEMEELKWLMSFALSVTKARGG